MISIQNISELVEGFVSGGIPASDLANSFALIFKSALKSDPSVRAVALEVHAQISHYFHALISEDELRSNLHPYGALILQPKMTFVYPIPVAPPNPYQAFALDEEGELVPIG
jgi:hypothetical protein